MAELPRFHVHKVESEPLRLVGRLSSTEYGSEKWVRPGWLGDLRVGNRFVTGRWAEANPLWTFSPKDANALQTIGELREFEVFEGYWAERAELVLDESLNWADTAWTDSSDHDHCRICWATISSKENTRHFAASPSSRVCLSCYSLYVKPRSIDFSQLHGPAA